MRSLLLTLTMSLFVVSTTTAQYSGGTGEPNDPYQIATAADLIALGETPEDYDKHFVLTADIDLDPNLPGRKVFDKAVIAPDMNGVTGSFEGTAFTGCLDGRNHTISHLMVRGTCYLGLFGLLGFGHSMATIRDVGVTGANVSGSRSFVGGLVGLCENGTMTGCHASGVVSGLGCVGGFVGWSRRGVVTRCHSTAAVTGKSDVGGLAGLSHGGAVMTQCCSEGTVGGHMGIGGLVGENVGTLTQCYSAATTSGIGDKPSSIGGLVGLNKGSITQCYSVGAVAGYYSVGGLVGANHGFLTECYSTGAVTSGSRPVAGLVGGSVGYATADLCFWDTQTSGQGASSGGVGKTTSEMQTAKTFLDAGWDFVGETANGTDDIWKIAEGLGYPRLSWEKYSGGSGEPNDPYQIATVADLIALGETPDDYDKHFVLAADIDLDPNLPGRKVFDRAVIAPDVNDLQYNFQGTAFTGAFDGSGRTIRNLTIADPNHDCLGLFGMIATGGWVGNLALENAEISGGRRSINVGTLAGYNAGTLAECSATGIAIGCGNVRELAGYNTGSITNCQAEVRVIWLCR